MTMEALFVERIIWIAAPRERVWRALTDGQQIEAWFSPGQPWEVSALEPGGTVVWHAEGEDALHVIQVVDPPRHFAYRWEPAPPETPLTTTYLLEEENGGTRLTVRETGYEQVPAELRQKRMQGSQDGYDNVLADLKRYLEAPAGAAPATLSVERAVLIAAPIDRVWQAVTDAQSLEQWYLPGSPWEIPALKAGGAVRFYHTPDDIQHAVIVALEAPYLFALRWDLSASYPGAALTTTLRLETAGEGTRVTISETGFETLAPEERAAAEQTGAGYAVALETLKTLVEGPAA